MGPRVCAVLSLGTFPHPGQWSGLCLARCLGTTSVQLLRERGHILCAAGRLTVAAHKLVLLCCSSSWGERVAQGLPTFLSWRLSFTQASELGHSLNENVLRPAQEKVTHCQCPLDARAGSSCVPSRPVGSAVPWVGLWPLFPVLLCCPCPSHSHVSMGSYPQAQ